MKKKLSLLLAFVLCLGLMPCAYADNNPFNDVAPGFWAYDAILETYNDGVMTGTASGVFSPSGKLNMAQFVTVLTRAFYNNDVVNSTREGAWPNQNYDAAEKHNLFAGLTRWGGDIEVTREVMAQMMYNVMVDKNVVLPNDTEIQATINKIPDIAAVDGNYRTAAAVCYYLELLAGVDAQGTFAPKGVLNRAQTAVIYTRLKKAVDVLSTGTSENSGTATPDTITPNTAQTSSEATLTNGMPVTEENVLALIEEYMNGKEPGEKAKEAGFTSYQHGSEYDAYSPKYRIVLPDGPINGIECGKFAYAFFDELFGETSPQRVDSPWDIRSGDLIHFNGHWAIAMTNAHSVDWTQDPCIYHVGGGPTGRIGWGNTDSALNDDYIEAFTRYPLPSETE